jgi:hypothetical protein
MVNQKNRSKPIFLIFAKIGQPIFDGFWIHGQDPQIAQDQGTNTDEALEESKILDDSDRMVGRLESKGKTTFIRGSIVICLFACLCNIVGWSTLLKLVRKNISKKSQKKSRKRNAVQRVGWWVRREICCGDGANERSGD